MLSFLIVVGVVCLAVGLAGGYWLPPHGHRLGKDRPKPVKRILLPFTGSSISRRAFDAAVRLATAENATIVPAFLARVPRYLPIESAVPAQCADGMPLLEAIEQKAAAQGLRSTRGSGVGAPTGMRCADCWPRSTSTG